jgi:hypothetical protein
MKRLAVILIAASCGVLFGQSRILEVQPKQTRDYDTNRGSGYCIVRLMVDDVVIVHIRGDRLNYETVRGRDARDDGSECSQAMPWGNALSNFRFRGVDGRGRVQLIDSPSASNNFTAKVQIQDPKGGDEGYTFRVEWTNLNPAQQPQDVSRSGGRRQRNTDSGWGTSSTSSSGWGTSSSTTQDSTGWGSGATSNTAWGQTDFDNTVTGTGAARMAGQPDLNLTSTRIRLRNNGQFVLEVVGTETVRFNGTWQREGDAAVLTIRNGFAGGGATGTGRAIVTNNQLQTLNLTGQNSRTNASFTVEFRNRNAARRLWR